MASGSTSTNELTAEFAATCTTAAFGYARATTAAYAAMAQQAVDFWSQATKRVEPRAQPVTFAVTRPSRSASSELQANMFDPFGVTKPWAALEREAMANMKAWWGLFPFEGNPVSWPMAFHMMKAGVPRDVALPAAEANIAAMDAARIAQQSVARIFSAYQSDGGHASAHFTSPLLAMSAPSKPQTPAFNPAAFMWPWIAAAQKSA